MSMNDLRSSHSDQVNYVFVIYMYMTEARMLLFAQHDRDLGCWMKNDKEVR